MARHRLLPHRRSALRTLTLTALTGLVALGGCASSPPPANPPAAMGVIPASTPDNNPEMASALALSQYVWTLNRVETQGQPAAFELPAAPDQRPELRFEPGEGGRHLFQGQLVVRKLCNTHSGAYRLERDQISAGPFMSTMVACADPALMQLERGMAQQLLQLQRWSIEPWIDRRLTTGNHPPQPTLRLLLSDGSQWHLSGRPTDELRLGGEATRVFLEVAPQTVPCTSPRADGAPCLRVRTLHYNEQGLVTQRGEWRTFSQPIEGWQHDPQFRQVLRLKHWPTRDVYVLDLVVETERAR